MPGSLTRRLSRIRPIIEWGGSYRRSDSKGDIAAGLTIGAMLVPQAMAYAMLGRPVDATDYRQAGADERGKPGQPEHEPT